MTPGIEVINRPSDLLQHLAATRHAAPADATAALSADQRHRLLRLSQPTLVVSIGGTGKQIADRIKAVFKATRGDKPVNFELLAFDSANDPISSVNERTGEVVTLEPGSESILLEPVPVSGIKSNMGRHRELVTTIGADAIYRINRAYISHGAAQDRTQGLLSLLWSGRDVERRVLAALRRLTEREKELYGEVGALSTIQVYICASPAGGQGAGAVQAVGVLVGQIMARMSTLGERGRIVGVMVLPGAFHGIENARMQANTFATIEELNAAMLGKVETFLHYPGGSPIRTNEPPFDYIYCFDGVDENGRTWPSYEDVCDLAARLVWLLCSSEVGLRELNAMINQTSVLTNVSDAGYGTYLATAGIAAIRYPAQEVAEQCAVRQAHAVLTHVLQGIDGEGSAALPGIRPPDAASLSMLREQLGANEEGTPHQPALAASATLEQLPLEDIPGKARLVVEAHMRRRIEEEIIAAIVRKKGRIVHAAQAALAEALAGYLDAGRLGEARALLAATTTSLEAGLAGVGAELDKTALLDEQSRFALDSAGAALEKSVGNFLTLNRRGQVRSALGVYLGEANTMAAQRVEHKILDSLAELLRSLLTWTQQQQRAFDSGVARLHQAREFLLAHSRELSRREGSRTELSLAEPELLDALFTRHAGPPAVDAPAVLADLGPLAGWMHARPQEVAQRVVLSVAPSFEPVLRLTVEEVLAMRWNEQSTQYWISRLETVAAAGWNPNNALLRGGGVDLASFLTIGVPDAARSLFANSGRTLVSTHDPERILVLRTLYGGSFDALKPYGQWKHAYDLLSPKLALHIYPGFQSTEDLSVQTFALSLIYGHVAKRGAWYYYTPADKLAAPIQLAQGLDNSLRTFRERRDVQDEVRGRIEATMAQEGSDRTDARITQWIEAGAGSADESMLRLRRAAQEILDRRTPDAASG